MALIKIKTAKGRIAFYLIGILLIAGFFGGPFLMEHYRRTHPIERQCTIESAETITRRSGTRGISTSSTELKVKTQECGRVYVDYVIAPKKSYRDMADELNQYVGQEVTFIFPPFQLHSSDEYAVGYGYRL